MLLKIKKIIQNIFRITKLEDKMSEQQQTLQKIFFFQCKVSPSPNLHIKDHGFSVFSQFDEDGIILYIFSIIGFTNKYCLDIAFANPVGANTTNLLLNWGFNGLLVCGDEKERMSSTLFFKSNHNTWLLPPKIINSWITAENIADTLLQNHVPKEIDFFSLDMDGVDYYILREILKVIQPRLIVVEAQNIWKTEKSVTVRYNSDFNRFKFHEDYCGASIPAFVKLMKENNYKLVAYNKYGFNIFFIKENIGEEYLPEINTEDCFANLPNYYIEELDKRRREVEHLDWIEV